MDNFQNINKIYYLGPEGSYASLAVKKFSSFIFELNKINKIPVKSIKDILSKIDSDKNSIAILPIENSIEGIVRETIDNFINLNDKSIKIFGETTLEINHCLASKSDTIGTIRHILSHPQALSQCQNFIFKNFNPENINIIPETSTSKALYKLSDLDNTFSAIGNPILAKELNLNILYKNINDEQDNKTRFILLSRNLQKDSNGKIKTQIIFSTKNQSGALADVLFIFKEYKINLTYIDSRPSRRTLGEYIFLADIEGDVNNSNIRNAIKEIKTKTSYLNINGSYKIYS